MQNTRRFIAGAICPQCHALDKIVLYSDADGQHRECVACGFKDDLQQLGSAPELITRVTPRREEADDEQSVTVVDLSTRSDSTLNTEK